MESTSTFKGAKKVVNFTKTGRKGKSQKGEKKESGLMNILKNGKHARAKELGCGGPKRSLGQNAGKKRKNDHSQRGPKYKSATRKEK